MSPFKVTGGVISVTFMPRGDKVFGWLSVALWCMLHRESFSLLPLSPFLTSIPPSLHLVLTPHAGNYATLCRAVRREEWRESCVCLCVCDGRWMEKERGIRVYMRAKERKAGRDLSSFINLSLCPPPSFITPIRSHTSSALSLLFHQGRRQGRSSHILRLVIGCRSRVGP